MSRTKTKKIVVIEEDDILSSDNWKNTVAFKSLKDKETQIKYYKNNNATPEVLQLVELESKPFGSIGEKIISEIFDIKKRTSSQNDGVINGKKIEIKCARYWVGTKDCRWQHLEPDHDYDYVLFCHLDFDRWNVWGIDKKTLFGKLRDDKIITYQGKQGWWTKKNDIRPYLKTIYSSEDIN